MVASTFAVARDSATINAPGREIGVNDKRIIASGMNTF